MSADCTTPVRFDRPARFPEATQLARRSLLKRSGLLMGTLAAGSPLALLAPSLCWAVELETLNDAQARTLLAFGRTLYPHPKLPDAVYALLVRDLDRTAASDAAQAERLKQGIASLDARAGGKFVDASPDKRLLAARALEGSPFFSWVRGRCITALYDNEMAFAAFGYPGASWPQGGYLVRGFQDLDWLPNPPDSASPRFPSVERDSQRSDRSTEIPASSASATTAGRLT